MSAFGLLLVAMVAVATLVTGLPAYVVLLMASVIGAVAGLTSGVIDIGILRGVGPRMINLLETDLLQALPLFLLMGVLLNRLPIADALFKCGAALFGKRRSGPVMSGFLLGALLGPMNGSVGASVGALARTLGPRLRGAGVQPPMTEAVISVAGTLGVVVPPSLVLILLGDAMLAAHTLAVNKTGRLDRVINTQDLLRGALVPAGIFLIVCLLIAAVTARRQPATEQLERPTSVDIAIAAGSLTFLLLLLGGVASGRFYAVEAAATGALMLFMWAALSGRLGGGVLGRSLNEVLVGTGTLFAPLLAATTFTLVLRLLGTDKLIEGWIAGLPGGPAAALIVTLGALAMLAFALDAFEIIFVGVPVLVPALLIRVDDAVWVGVLVLFVLQASFLLPPMGYAWLLTRASMPDKAKAADTLRALAPFLGGQLAVLALVIAMPALVHVFDTPGSRTRGPAVVGKPANVDDVLRQLPSAGIGIPGLPGLPPMQPTPKPTAPK